MEKIGRNDPCPCGSGKKFKNCHLGHEDELFLIQSEELKKDVREKSRPFRKSSMGDRRKWQMPWTLESSPVIPRFQG